MAMITIDLQYSTMTSNIHLRHVYVMVTDIFCQKMRVKMLVKTQAVLLAFSIPFSCQKKPEKSSAAPLYIFKVQSSSIISTIHKLYLNMHTTELRFRYPTEMIP